MTKREAAVIQAYTGYVILAGDDMKIFYKYCKKLLGFTLYTHEYIKYADEIKELSKPDFIEICKNLED